MGVCTLLESSIEAVSQRIESYKSLNSLPEELCLLIFEVRALHARDTV